MSACLRLSASFIGTLMALDCFCATVRPLFYRTKVTCVNVAKIVGCGILSAAFIAAFPAIGWGRVNAHRGLCSFDFGSGFALFIAILGYIQLLWCWPALSLSHLKWEDTREDWIDWNAEGRWPFRMVNCRLWKHQHKERIMKRDGRKL